MLHSAESFAGKSDGSARLVVFVLMGFWVKVAAVVSYSCPVPSRKFLAWGLGWHPSL